MKLNFRPGWTWLWHAGENATGAASVGAASVLAIVHPHYLHDVPWGLMASAAAVGVLGSALKSIASELIGPGRNNGTASNLPAVIARDKAKP